MDDTNRWAERMENKLARSSLSHLFFSPSRKTFNRHAKKGGEPRERAWVGKERDVKNERERRRNRTLIALALISSSLTDNSAPSFIVERSHVRFRLARNPNRISLLF